MAKDGAPGILAKNRIFLRSYERAYTPMRWFRHWGGLTRGRQGYLIFLRFVFLVGLYVAAYYLPLHTWGKILLTIIAGYLIADMFMLPTSIAFGGILPCGRCGL